MKICIPVTRDEGLESPVSAHFGSAPYYLLVDSETLAAEAVPNGRSSHEHGACRPLDAISGRGVGTVLVGGIGPGAIAGLGAAGIAVLRVTASTAREGLEQLKSGLASRIGPAEACSSHGGGHGHGHDHAPARGVTLPGRD